MAVLTDPDRDVVSTGYQRDESRSVPKRMLGLTKQELRDAIDATDDWIDQNAGDFNSALPLPARTALSAKQKAKLFMAVASRRFDVN